VDPRPADRARIQRLLGAGIVSMTAVRDRGYANNLRWLVTVADGRSAFVKQATDEATAGWLRQEHLVYQGVVGDLGPRLLGWDDGVLPMLVLEDLSGCDWPPPWDQGRVDAVMRSLAELGRRRPVPGLPGAGETAYADGWAEVAADPAPLLSLGLCSPGWLDRALPLLVAAAVPDLLDGDAVVHLDVRSDNVCFRRERALLVDWNLAALGNPDFDLAFWLPSLRAEGGPEPEQVADIAPGIVALVAGFFAARAGLPVIPHAPRVRAVQRTQLAVALPWAARALGLPPPDQGASPVN
jgi:hypothetical protein